jgi:2,4-dienoyl-CoA reductase-like NADH-dependent reductase (Old Yellow Enzyme family)
MVPWRATDTGECTPELLEWYGRFAEGQPGAIVVEATGIRDIPSGPLLRAGHPRFIEGLQRLVQTVRERSEGQTRLFIQLIDFLRIHRRPPPERYFARFFQPTDAHRKRLAARTGDSSWGEADDMGIRGFLSDGVDDLHRDILTSREYDSLTRGERERITDTHLAHVRDLPQQLPALFARAARHCLDAGFDGVELHYAHAYTMASFLSRRNTRQDGYGETLEGRIRLPLEVLAAVRDEVGTDPVVGCRMLGDEIIEGGSRIEDTCFFGLRLAEAGMHYLSISTGGKFEDAKAPRVGEAIYPYTGQSGYECMPTVLSDSRGPFGRNLSPPAAIRHAIREAGLSTPVVAAGGIQTFAMAEEALIRGDADIIAAARQSIADPDWWRKMREGRGSEIRRCLCTNYCEALDQRHKQVTCQLWDRTQLDEPGLLLSDDGKRRLIAPRKTPDKSA